MAEGSTPEQVANNFKILVSDIQEINPTATIVIVGLPPRPYDLDLAKVQEYNNHLNNIEGCKYTNEIHESFLDEKGEAILEYFNPDDYWPLLHPTVKSKKYMARILQRLLLKELENKGIDRPSNNVIQGQPVFCRLRLIKVCLFLCSVISNLLLSIRQN